MFLTRKNLNGGRKLHSFPLCEENGILGTKIGYCDHCNEQILLKTSDRDEIIAYLWKSKETYKMILNKLQPRISFKDKFLKWIVGKLGESQVISGAVYN